MTNTIDKFPCPECKEKFRYKVNLEHHLDKMHNNRKEEQAAE